MTDIAVLDLFSYDELLSLQWKSLPKEEQAKYFLEAEREKHLHSLKHPGWSCKDNYVCRRLIFRSITLTENLLS